MKLLSVAIPSYNSESYLRHAVDSLLAGGEDLEILIINDGSTDGTASIADEYQNRYPRIVRAVHQENGGHGSAVMRGLNEAQGLYYKVVDSDDFVDQNALKEVLDTLKRFRQPTSQIDLLISNYVYDKVGVKRAHAVGYVNALPRDRVFTWDDVGRFRVGQYILMHSAIFRTELLRTCGLQLPSHTYYVDNLFVYVPMVQVEKMFYLDVNLYHYFIGRADQSVQEQVMIKRLDQQIRVNKLMSEAVDLCSIHCIPKRRYLRNHLQIVSTVSSVLAIKSGASEKLQKRDELWSYFRRHTPGNERMLSRRPLGKVSQFRGLVGRQFVIYCYQISRRIYNFN